MTEIGLREALTIALFDAFRDGFEEAYGERPEGWAETSEDTREVWRKEADALLPTEGEPVGVVGIGHDGLPVWSSARNIGEPRPYGRTALLYVTPQESAEDVGEDWRYAFGVVEEAAKESSLYNATVYSALKDLLARLRRTESP